MIFTLNLLTLLNAQNITAVQSEGSLSQQHQSNIINAQGSADTNYNKKNKKPSKSNRMGDLLGDLFDF